MNGVPGVIVFESKPCPSLRGGTLRPCAAHSALSFISSSSFSAASCADLKRRARCWFIFARGATPSMAMKSILRGRTAAKTRSRYAKMARYMSSSVSGGGRSSGWDAGWMMPFMSKKRLSYSMPLGLALDVSTGICVPSSVHVCRSSMQSTTIFGYLTDSHLKKAGTPMLPACGADGPAGELRACA